MIPEVGKTYTYIGPNKHYCGKKCKIVDLSEYKEHKYPGALVRITFLHEKKGKNGYMIWAVQVKMLKKI